MKLETIAVHAGSKVDPETGAVAPPIHLSTTYEHGPAAEEIHGYLYIREGNPTQARLEEALAALEGGEGALAFASGVGAGTALAQAIGAGSHIIFPDDMYVDFRNLARDFLLGWGMQSDEVNMQDAAGVARAFKPNTKLLWLETPSNPLMKIVDIVALVKLAHGRGALVVVDNTFGTPVLQRVLDLGADFALHSTTKYFGGHSDVQGGALIAKRKDEVFKKLMYVRQVTGGVASPFNSWLVLRGIRSLACRVQKHSENGMALAQALSKSKAISAVHYPGLPTHPGHEIAKRQMSGFGGMLSIQLKGGRDAALKTTSRVKLFTVATSLGGVESLIEHRASSEGKSSKAPDDLLRISVGLEDAGDLIADLEQALRG